MVRTFVSAAVSGESKKYEILRKFREAVKTLNTLQSNAQTLEKIRREKDRAAHLNIPKIQRFAERVGIQLSDMDKLNVIHVSGTKGKGSTCAFCESILRNQGYKTGFFSSPHLVEVRERFCIDGRPIEREKFASYFWEVYNQLQLTKKADVEEGMPNYFGFLVVMAFHVFLQEKVDVAIMEVGIGGQYDSTNVVRNPLVCGVTSLGLDHVSVLGTTIDKIAWHKAGIFKPGVPAFTAPQVPEAMAVLKSRAEEISCPLSVCPDLELYGKDIRLGIQGQVQRVNASLALQITNTWIKQFTEKSRETTQTDETENGVRNEDISTTLPSSDQPSTSTVCDIPVALPFQLTKQHYIGLEQCQWLGRNQKLEEQGCTFYLDGAHTVESIEQCVDWFQAESLAESKKQRDATFRVLIYNTTGDRDRTRLILPLMRCHFDAVLFCPNLAYIENMSYDQTNNTVTKEMQLERCLKNKETWEALSKSSDVEHLDKERSDKGAGNHVETNDSVQGNGMPTSLAESDGSTQTQLVFLPSISHCINWVRLRKWKNCPSKIFMETESKQSVINSDSDDDKVANGVTDKLSNGHEPVQAITGEFRNHLGPSSREAETTGEQNGFLHENSVVHERESHVQVLVTGSLHLVGGALKVLWDSQ